jgi:hypothetical protein
MRKSSEGREGEGSGRGKPREGKEEGKGRGRTKMPRNTASLSTIFACAPNLFSSTTHFCTAAS